MEIDDEIVIGRVGEQAHATLANRRFGQFGQDWTERAPQRVDFIFTDAAVDVIGTRDDLPVVHDRSLHSPRKLWESVADRPRLEFMRVDGETAGLVGIRGPGRLEPEYRLSLDQERQIDT